MFSQGNTVWHSDCSVNSQRAEFISILGEVWKIIKELSRSDILDKTNRPGWREIENVCRMGVYTI